MHPLTISCSAPLARLSGHKHKRVALQAARLRQQTSLFAKPYALREGIEATISQGVRAFGMRRSRYIGEAKTHLQHIGIAAARSADPPD